MKYNDLIDLILAKLNLTPDEANYDGVLTKIPPLCNECLGDVANRGKPYYKMLIIDVVSPGTTITSGNLIENESVSTTRFVTMPADFIAMTNEFIQRCAITVSDGAVTEDEDYYKVEGREFRRMNSRQLLFPNDFGYRYLIPVLCRYPTITNSDSKDIAIEQSILDLIPNYVVSELIRVDDVVLSTTYRNLYESSLAALNDTVLDPAGNLHNEGW